MFCSLCKQTQDPKYNWMIEEHGAESTVNKFKICDECAGILLRRMTTKALGIREGQEVPDPLLVSKTGVIEEIGLNMDNSLDITISLDICKARRWIEKGIDE